MPFTSDQFFGVFALYNRTFILVAVALWLASVGAVGFVSRDPERRSRTLSRLLAVRSAGLNLSTTSKCELSQPPVRFAGSHTKFVSNSSSGALSASNGIRIASTVKSNHDRRVGSPSEGSAHTQSRPAPGSAPRYQRSCVASRTGS